MKSHGSFPGLAPAVLLAIFLVLVGLAPAVTADCEEELAETQRELEKVKKERDDYAQRLEDSTDILIIVLILMVSSYVIFFYITKRQQMLLQEIVRRTGVNLDSPEKSRPKRRRG